MNKKVREITSDAIFTALVTAMILIFKYLFTVVDTLLLLFLSVFIAVRYYRESFKRMAAVSLAILLISFLYFDIPSILLFVLPGLLIGNAAHYLLRIVLNPPYYLITVPVYFTGNVITEMLYAKTMLGMDFQEFLSSGMDLPAAMTESLGKTGLFLLFLGYCLVISLMESVIIRKSVFIYHAKLKNLKIKRH